MEECQHDFVHQGLIAVHGNHNRPGSGAVNRYYAHVYFCRHCLTKRYERVPGDFSSYQPITQGAVWGSNEDKKAIVGKYE